MLLSCCCFHSCTSHAAHIEFFALHWLQQSDVLRYCATFSAEQNLRLRHIAWTKHQEQQENCISTVLQRSTLHCSEFYEDVIRVDNSVWLPQLLASGHHSCILSSVGMEQIKQLRNGNLKAYTRYAATAARLE
jgi:hypothetical protein